MEQEIPLCNAQDLKERADAIPFDVLYGGQTCRAFAIRYEGVPYAYLNRCSHVAMEMDYQPNRFWDFKRKWLMCATHGAVYEPQSGQCVSGPCKRGLIKINVIERDGVVHWITDHQLQPVIF